MHNKPGRPRGPDNSLNCFVADPKLFQDFGACRYIHGVIVIKIAASHEIQRWSASTRVGASHHVAIPVWLAEFGYW